MAFCRQNALPVVLGRVLCGSKRSVVLESGARACPALSKSCVSRKCIAVLGALVDSI